MTVQPAPQGTLVAWDVDKTLLEAGAAGSEIMDAAITRALDRVPEHDVWFGGKTDPRIAAEILTAAGVPAPHDGHITEVLQHLEETMAGRAHLLPVQGRVLPGVREILPKLRAAGCLQTVLTGNIQVNAMAKLAAFGLDEFLDVAVGAFGSDHADRRRLLPLVLDRAADAYRRHWMPEQTWVVGDTVFDLECAQAAGARCLLVATGSTDYAQLSALGADAVLPDLSDVAGVVDLLRS